MAVASRAAADAALAVVAIALVAVITATHSPAAAERAVVADARSAREAFPYGFLHVPKTGGTTVKASFGAAGVQLPGGRQGPFPLDSLDARYEACSAWHRPPAEVAERRGGQLADETFAVVRHPYDRMLSEWRWTHALLPLFYEHAEAAVRGEVCPELANSTGRAVPQPPSHQGWPPTDEAARRGRPRSMETAALRFVAPQSKLSAGYSSCAQGEKGPCKIARAIPTSRESEWARAACNCGSFRRWAQCAVEIATSRFEQLEDCHFLPQWRIARHATRVHRLEDGLDAMFRDEVSRAVMSGWNPGRGVVARDANASTVAVVTATQRRLICPAGNDVGRHCFDQATYAAVHRLFADDFVHLGYEAHSLDGFPPTAAAEVKVSEDAGTLRKPSTGRVPARPKWDDTTEREARGASYTKVLKPSTGRVPARPKWDDNTEREARGASYTKVLDDLKKSYGSKATGSAFLTAGSTTTATARAGILAEACRSNGQSGEAWLSDHRAQAREREHPHGSADGVQLVAFSLGVKSDALLGVLLASAATQGFRPVDVVRPAGARWEGTIPTKIVTLQAHFAAIARASPEGEGVLYAVTDVDAVVQSGPERLEAAYRALAALAPSGREGPCSDGLLVMGSESQCFTNVCRGAWVPPVTDSRGRLRYVNGGFVMGNAKALAGYYEAIIAESKRPGVRAHSDQIVGYGLVGPRSQLLSSDAPAVRAVKHPRAKICAVLDADSTTAFTMTAKETGDRDIAVFNEPAGFTLAPLGQAPEQRPVILHVPNLRGPARRQFYCNVAFDWLDVSLAGAEALAAAAEA